ncbi:MAG: hypothetical protein HUK21_12905 [Fibrobacteraceae bacterium]|nr:hypothetical protein [Fibrobacteraceae bacterium]
MKKKGNVLNVAPEVAAIGEVDGEKNEIAVYQPEGGEFHIEVRVEQDTVWLTQAQSRAKRTSQNQACLIL